LEGIRQSWRKPVRVGGIRQSWREPGRLGGNQEELEEIRGRVGGNPAELEGSCRIKGFRLSRMNQVQLEE
jgi:hypothetical protein